MVHISDETYRRIEKYALLKMAKSKNSRHDDGHVLRVRDNALKIVKLLSIENEVDSNLIKTICLLHDFTYTARRSNPYTYIFEGHIEKKIISPILEKFNLSDQAKGIIINAVYRHAHSYPFRILNKNGDVYTKVLQDADTLDLFACVRLKTFVGEKDRGVFNNIKRYLATKYDEYGLNNLTSYLNYPGLAESFFTDGSKKCF